MEFNHPMHHCINQRAFSNSLTIFPKKISVRRPTKKIARYFDAIAYLEGARYVLTNLLATALITL